MTESMEPDEIHRLALALEAAAEKLLRGKPPTPGLLLKAAHALHEAAEKLQQAKGTPTNQ
jgi:hypothetical protein